MNDFFTFEQLFAQILKKISIHFQQENVEYIHDDDKHIVIKISSTMIPLGIKILKEPPMDERHELWRSITQQLLKAYARSILKHFEVFSYEILDIVNEVKDAMIEDEHIQRSINTIQKTVIDNLRLSPVTCHGFYNILSVKSNGILELFDVYFNQNEDFSAEKIKKELVTLLSEFYIQYLNVLKIQKRLILTKLREANEGIQPTDSKFFI